MSVPVQLGEHEFRALPQPHAYLLHHLSGIVADVIASGGDLEDGTEVVQFLGTRTYDALNVLLAGELKKRLPAHEFHGYPSKEAMDAGAYDDETARKSPTVPQIVEAFETCIEINGGEFFKKLFGLVDPKVVRALITERIAESLSETSPSSPPTNGTSASTSSGGPVPTPIPIGSGSPSDASTN